MRVARVTEESLAFSRSGSSHSATRDSTLESRRARSRYGVPAHRNQSTAARVVMRSTK